MRRPFELEKSLFENRRKSAPELIRECQAVLAEYLPPDSGITAEEALNRLLGILDGPEAQRFARKPR